MTTANNPSMQTQHELEDHGYMSANVEKFIMGANIRRDLYGIIDIVGVGPVGRPLVGVLGIQATTGDHLPERIAKAMSKDIRHNLMRWIAASNRFEVWGWVKRPKSKGSKVMIWRYRCFRFSLTPRGRSLKHEEGTELDMDHG